MITQGGRKFIVARRKEEVNAAAVGIDKNEKREATRLGKSFSYTEA